MNTCFQSSKGDYLNEERTAKNICKRRRDRQNVKRKIEGKISQCRGKSNLPPGGTEGSKSIHNGHMIRARKTAHREEEPKG